MGERIFRWGDLQSTWEDRRAPPPVGWPWESQHAPGKNAYRCGVREMATGLRIRRAEEQYPNNVSLNPAGLLGWPVARDFSMWRGLDREIPDSACDRQEPTARLQN